MVLSHQPVWSGVVATIETVQHLGIQCFASWLSMCKVENLSALRFSTLHMDKTKDIGVKTERWG